MPLIRRNETRLKFSVGPLDGTESDNAHVAQAEIEFDTPGI